MEELLNGAAWVILTFADGTKQCIYTSLCPSFCKERHVVLKSGYFFDFVSNEYIEFRKDAVDIEISKEKPVFKEEVLKFASRFI